MIILFFLLLVGYAANRAGIMNADFNKKFSGLILYISNPALILHSVMNTEHSISNIEVLMLLGIALLSYGLVIAVSFLIPGILRADQSDRNVYRFMMIFSNTGFMGYPVVEALMGHGAIFYATIFGIPFNLLVFSYGIHLISSGSAGKANIKTLLSPCIIAAVASIVIYFINPRFPDVVVSTFGYLSDITVPGAMLIIGSSLAMIPLKSVFGDWRIYGMTAIKLLLVPVIVWLIMRFVPVDPMIRQFVVLMWALPVATNSTMLAAQYGGNESLASKGVLITTFLSLATIPLLMWLLPFS